MIRSAFSVIEVILATALFAVFSTGVTVAVLSGLNLNQSATEQTIANQYATEGLEAVRSIRNQNYVNLANGNWAVTATGGVWAMVTPGAGNNTFDKYTRAISISDVQRDGSGNVVPTGVPDPNTKKVAVNVTWQTGVKNLSTGVTSYLTNWKMLPTPTPTPSPIPTPGPTGTPGPTPTPSPTSTPAPSIGDAIALYSEGNNPPRWRSFDASTGLFGSENSLPTAATARIFIVKTSPIKQEAIAGYVDTFGILQVLCFDGANWSSDWNVAVGGTITTRRFDIAYETSSGNAIVLYSTNAGTNELAYRTKPSASACGTGWSGATTFDSPATNGVVHYVKMASDPRSGSNLISAIWADNNSDLQAAVWSGSAWTQRVSALETSLEIASLSQDVEDFAVKYESLSGDVMVVWANSSGKNGTNGVRYVTCPGGTAGCTWSAVITAPVFSDDATNLDLAANPNSDEMVFASIGNSGSDLQIGYWSGSAWTDNQNVDTSTATPVPGTKLVATGWLINGGASRSIVAYNDDTTTNVGWYVCNLGVCTLQTDFTPAAFSSPQKWYDIQTDPFNKEQLVLMVADVNNALWAKKLAMTAAPAFTWTNADNNVALELSMSQAIISPFGFAYWRLP